MADPSTSSQAGNSVDERLGHLGSANRNARQRCRRLITLVRETQQNESRKLVELERKYETEQHVWQAELAALKNDRDRLAEIESVQANQILKLQQELAEFNSGVILIPFQAQL